MPLAVRQDFEQTFGVRILEGYGLSETSPVACFNQVQWPSRPGTVGLPLFACEVRVVDEQDQSLPSGERGEILIRGHNVMKGYWRKPDATAEAISADGWFRSGDLAVMRFDGDITSTSEEAVLGQYKALPAGTTKILLDFSKVPYLNSSGIALVIQLMMDPSIRKMPVKPFSAPEMK